MELSVKIVAAAVALAAIGFLLLRSGGDLGPAEAKRLVAEGAMLVDVRTPGEFSAGHLEGALNIPLQDLERRVEELGAKDRPLVLYCRSGARSGRAASWLKGQGFARVHNLGAMSRW